jgi:hypothetical protein
MPRRLQGRALLAHHPVHAVERGIARLREAGIAQELPSPA